MVAWLKQVAYALSLRFKSRTRLKAETLALRQQVNVLIRKLPKRLQLRDSDRLLVVWLYRLFSSILIVRPKTAIIRFELILPWTRTRRSSGTHSGSVRSWHGPRWTDYIITTSESEFSVITGRFNFDAQ
jgi:hypothetical protein